MARREARPGPPGRPTVRERVARERVQRSLRNRVRSLCNRDVSVPIIEAGNFYAVDSGVVGTPSGAGGVGSATASIVSCAAAAVPAAAAAAPGSRASAASESSVIAPFASDSSVHETLCQGRRTVTIADKPRASLGIAGNIIPASAVRSSGRAEIPGIPRISAVPRDPSAGFVSIAIAITGTAPARDHNRLVVDGSDECPPISGCYAV